MVAGGILTPEQAYRRRRLRYARSAARHDAHFRLPFSGRVHNFVRPDLMWKTMALATTFAGNLTILGSVANIIVVESARTHLEISFWDYARYGIPVTLLTTVVGMLILVLLG
jgi:Na+/H+ antiporter NhaD/arsenite permease-like protein